MRITVICTNDKYIRILNVLTTIFESMFYNIKKAQFTFHQHWYVIMKHNN